MNNKWNLVVIGAGIVILLALIYFVFFGVANAKQEDKVYWCHTEPNGNSQTLHLPLAALQNAGHVNAQGNPLHAGDYAGACIEPSITPSVTPNVTPTPTQDPCIYTDKGRFAIEDDEVVPCEPSITPEPTKEPSATPTPEITYPPSTDKPEGDGKDSSGLPVSGDGLSDGLGCGSHECKATPTLIPCSVPNTCGWK